MRKRTTEKVTNKGKKETGVTRRVARKQVGNARKRNLPIANEVEITVQSDNGEMGIAMVKSPKEFHDTVSVLSTDKVVAVSEMGFGSLQLIGCPVLYPNVCQLMIAGMDPLNEKITIHGKEFSLRASDFARIMGIKDGGSEVDLTGDMGSELFKSVAQALTCGEGRITTTSLKQIVIESESPDGVFKIAYVLLALVALLCPAGNEEIDRALLFPLLDTRRIVSKNWATFCFNKLFASVLTFKASHFRSNIAGSMTFLQLYYFEAVGGSRGWVDKTLRPIQAWGVTEAEKLLRLVEQRGGVHDCNTSVWAPTTMAPVGDGRYRNIASLASHKKATADPKIYAEKAEVELLKIGLKNMEKIVGRLHPEVCQLTVAMGRAELKRPGLEKEDVKEIVVELLRELRSHEAAVNVSSIPSQHYSPTTQKKSNAIESQGGNDGTGAENKASGDSSCRVVFFRNTNEAPTDDTRVQETQGVGNMMGPEPPSDISELSVSPAGPPKLCHRSGKKKMNRRPTTVCRQKARQLLKHRTSKIASHLKNWSALRNARMLTYELPAGPFNVRPEMSLRDISLLRNLFLEGVPGDVKPRYDRVVIARDDRRHVTRQDVASLGPDSLLSGMVIDIFAGYLNQPNGTDWYLPTYFGENANQYDAATGYQGWVQETRSVCALDTFGPRINECRRIFIPMREPGAVGHWYLLVVHVKDKTAEIIDSAPDELREDVRQEAARLALNMLDSVFFEDVISRMDIQNQVLFGSFKSVKPKQTLLQPNGYDCGIFVIRNMQHYGENWAAQYTSDEHRAALIIECVRNPKNTVLEPERLLEEAIGRCRMDTRDTNT